MASRILFTEDTLRPRLRQFPARMDSALGAFTAFEAPQVQSYMRDHAPWTDRTTNARNGLFAKPFGDNKGRGVVCYHTMPYGIWLEVRNEGRYAIINPTILAEGKRMMRDLKRLMGMMK